MITNLCLKRIGFDFRKTVVFLMVGFLSFSTINAYAVAYDAFDETVDNNLQQQVSGTVTSQDGVPLPGAAVVVEGTNRGSQTDFDGNYSVEASEGEVLVFSYLGMETQRITVGATTTINVTLQENASALEEVVVVGYGTAKKRDITGAVETLTASTIQDRAVASAPELLQGRLPGLNINYASGNIAAVPNINIRGPESINGGDPLILIDGVPQVNAAVLTQMNPNDIESISVLKDAASAAIYGSRASFGVILVTTKSGKFNQKFSATIESFTKLTTQAEFPKFINSYQHALGVNEARRRRGNNPFFDDYWLSRVKAYHEDPANNPIDEIINPEYDSEGNLIGGIYHYYGTTDYMNETFKRNAFQQKTDLRITGGGENTRIFASLNYTKDEGFFKTGNEDLNIYNFRINTDSKVTDWLKVGTRVNYIKRIFDRPFQYHDFYEETYLQRIYFPLRNRGNGLFLQHSIGYLNSGARDVFEDDDITLNINTEAQLAKNLKVVGEFNYNANIGLNKENVYQIEFADNFAYRYPITATWNALARQSWIYHRTRKRKSFIADVFATYENTFNEKHEVTAMVGFNQQSFNELAYSSRSFDVITESVPAQNLTTGETPQLGQSEFDWAIRAGFYRLNYTFDDKYLFTFNGRYDLTSRFRKDSRSVFTPSASAGWRISNEKFFEGIKDKLSLNNLMFRANYGTSGNQQVDTYAYIPTLPFTQREDYVFGNNVNAVAITGAPDLVNPQLTWETVTTLGFGLDFAALNNRLSGSFDYYKRTTEDMLVDGGTVPSILGTGAPEDNAAALEVTGYEATLSWRDRIGEDFSYGVGLNFYDSRGFYTKYDLNPSNSFGDIYVGREIGEIWGLTTEGYFQTQAEADTALAGGTHDQSFVSGSGRGWKPGDIKYADLNGNGEIDNGDGSYLNSGDYKVIGNSSARYNYGINLDLGYKNWSFSAFFQGVGKRDINPGTALAFWPWRSGFDNIRPDQLDTWSEDNTDAYFPQPELDATRNYQTQSKYLQNGAFLKLRNVSLAYTLPQATLDKLPISGLTLTFVGTNLWESTNMRGPFDPERSIGIQTPFRRTFTLGARIKI
jgi:TonB-linked SusC/RagA family outer membrane protein